MKPLNAVDAKISEKGHLRCGLDASDQDCVSAIANERNHVLKHCQAALIGAVVQEFSIHFYGMELDCAKQRQSCEA
jgi:hypothetical protein